MAAIGSLSVDAWRGSVQGMQQSLEVFTRAGVDGSGLLVNAYHGVPYTVETDFYGTLAGVQSWRATALTYPGTVVSVTDSDSYAWANTAVLGVEFIIRRAKGLGGTNTHIITATWQMISE